jgi:hypothetical protein
MMVPTSRTEVSIQFIGYNLLYSSRAQQILRVHYVLCLSVYKNSRKSLEHFNYVVENIPKYFRNFIFFFSNGILDNL